MKRDYDLVREVLLWIEDKMPPAPADELPEWPSRDRDELVYHIYLLEDGGFITILRSPEGGIHPLDAICWCRITWSGHDFIDTVRDDKIWKAAKQKASQAGSFSIDLLKEIAKELLRANISALGGRIF